MMKKRIYLLHSFWQRHTVQPSVTSSSLSIHTPTPPPPLPPLLSGPPSTSPWSPFVLLLLLNLSSGLKPICGKQSETKIMSNKELSIYSSKDIQYKPKQYYQNIHCTFTEVSFTIKCEDVSLNESLFWGSLVPSPPQCTNKRKKYSRSSLSRELFKTIVCELIFRTVVTRFVTVSLKSINNLWPLL